MNAELTDTAALINEETQGSTRSDVEQLGSEICALAGQIAAATARFVTLLSKFDEDRGWTVRDFTRAPTGCRGSAE